MIRVERDPAFWGGVAQALGAPHDAERACTADNVLPLASERGGFLFARLDLCGAVCELHTLYRPDAWASREIVTAGREALNAVFLLGYQVVTTFEVKANPKSQPPRSFGFIQAGEWRDSPVGAVRLWTLSVNAWRDSPVNRRHRCRSH